MLKINKKIAFLLSTFPGLLIGANVDPFNDSSAERNEENLSPIIIPSKNIDKVTTASQNSSETNKYFDKDTYIKKTYVELQEQEENAKINFERSSTFSNIFVIFSSLTTAVILIVTIVGATKYIEPSLSNLLASICAAFNGVFLWASVQTKKMANAYYQERVHIQRVLNVPEKLIVPDSSASLDPFGSK